jgi:CubicO group peptidase (beta-lactamase class C family)
MDFWTRLLHRITPTPVAESARQSSASSESYPDNSSWPRARPRDEGMSASRLDAINPRVMGDAVVIRHAREVRVWGDPDAPRHIASCSRSFVTLAWLSAIHEGIVPQEFIDRPIRDVFPDSAAAQLFDPAVLGCHLLSYTSGVSPVGSRYQYSGGQDGRGEEGRTRKHWPRQHVLFREVTSLEVWDYLNLTVFPTLGRGLVADGQTTEDGTTCRVRGSARDQARFALLLLRGGRWRSRRLLGSDLVARAIAGGPFGDGKPFPLEGWQIHLVRDERAWELPNLRGVPDGFMARDSGGPASSKGIIAGFPTTDLIVVYRSRTEADDVLRAVCRAVVS